MHGCVDLVANRAHCRASVFVHQIVSCFSPQQVSLHPLAQTKPGLIGCAIYIYIYSYQAQGKGNLFPSISNPLIALSLSLYKYRYVSTYMYMCIIWIHLDVYTHRWNMCASIRTYIYVYIYICTYACIHVYTYTCPEAALNIPEAALPTEAIPMRVRHDIHVVQSNNGPITTYLPMPLCFILPPETIGHRRMDQPYNVMV